MTGGGPWRSPLRGAAPAPRLAAPPGPPRPFNGRGWLYALTAVALVLAALLGLLWGVW